MGEDGAPDVVLCNFADLQEGTGAFLGGPAYDTELLSRDPVAFCLCTQIPNFGLYRRGSFCGAGGFDEDPAVLYNEDVALHQRLALAGLTFAFDPLVTCFKYHYPGSMSAANRRKCAEAQVALLHKTARILHSRGLHQYDGLIGHRLWECAAAAATWNGWAAADAAALRARDLGSRLPPNGSPAFRAAAYLAPRTALWLREHAIRLLRPSLRTRGQRG